MSDFPASEEARPSKAELFAQNPDRFIDLDECPVAVIRDPETKKIRAVSIRMTDVNETYIVEGMVREAVSDFRAQLRLRAQKTGIVGANNLPKPRFGLGGAFGKKH